MAVENKFKINVIAASVLMGLSLSAMTSAVATDKEVAPAPVKTTLAEAVKAVKPGDVTFYIGGEKNNPSRSYNLPGLLDYLGKGGITRDDASTSVGYAYDRLASTYQGAQTA
ncbi:hypothetical protein CBH50_005309, partial [Salmonella enterica subsp. diarizonae serovar 60:r:e,n,x,z15]|nr:hypothetical protein [Salmonella enterica subsp. diarizonae serovar 60:r:e,n,x,z15]